MRLKSRIKNRDALLTALLACFIFSLFLTGNLVTAQSSSCAGTNQVVQLRIENPIGSVLDYFQTRLCGSSASTCSGLTVQVVNNVGNVQGQVNVYTLVVMENFPLALETSLYYVADVRARYLQVNGQTVSEGNPNAGVSASAVYLLNPSYSVSLFLDSPPNPYSVQLKFFPSCSPSTGLWALSFIGIPVVYLLLLRNPFSVLEDPYPTIPPNFVGIPPSEHPLPPQQPQALQNAGLQPTVGFQVPRTVPSSSNTKSEATVPSHSSPVLEQEVLSPLQIATAQGEEIGDNYRVEGVEYAVLEDGKSYEVEHRRDPDTGIIQTIYIDPETREEYCYE